MSPHLFRLRSRRFWRRQTSHVEDLSHAAGQQLEQNFLARVGRLRKVWRFVAAWTLLLVFVGVGVLAQLSNLKSYYQRLEPVPGGIYSEGLAGTFTTANPLYAVSDVDTSVSTLLFAGLLTYDNSNQLVGDLADWWRANDTGTVYTVHLRPNLTWQDGKPLTSADVVFTYQTIQDPDVQSPLFSSWQGVTVAAVDSRTISFTLPNPLSSFPYSLTNGIVPQHILQGISAVDLRSAGFNTEDPIGSGPFAWGSLGITGSGDSLEEQITLTPFSHYWSGPPKLTSFNLYAFANTNNLIQAYESHEIMAVVGLDSVPDFVRKDSSSYVYNVSLTAGVYVFFKTSSGLFADAKVRQALTMASNRGAVIARLGYPARAVDEPILKDQLGYNPVYAQATNLIDQAKALLDADGWVVGAGGVRSKAGQDLTFTLSLPSNPEYNTVADTLRDEWRAVGADIQVASLPAADFQGALAQHAYDAVLYGISIGADPDVFVYWDSSQADPRSANRLNFSEYKSSVADLALETARTRLDPSLRAAKYRSFLQAWQRDAPALGLYQPRLLIISHSPIYGIGDGAINADAGRYRSVSDWTIHLGWVTNP